MNTISVENLKDSFKYIQTFVSETPLFVVASTAGGIVGLTLFPKFAPPLLMIAGSFFVTRVVIKIIEKYDSNSLGKTNARMSSFDSKYGYLHYVAMVVSLLFCAISPLLGIFLAIGVGIYKGVIREIQVNQLLLYAREDRLLDKNNGQMLWTGAF